jgi:hypothetical protein
VLNTEFPLAAEPAAKASGSLTLPGPYLLFLGDTTEPGFAKTAFGLRDWAPDRCVGEFVLPGAAVSTGLPRLGLEQAYARGARALLIGVASPGGAIPPHWVPSLLAALEAGLDIVAGMHVKLNAIPELRRLAESNGRRLVDVRTPPAGIGVATGRKRSGKRLLTVGTDCALGKKYTALAIARGLQERGLDATFRATGQTGIMIAGSGIPIDAVVADFVAGAAEALTPRPIRRISTSSRARVRSITPPMRQYRSACFTAANPISSSSATSLVANASSACPTMPFRRSRMSSRRRSRWAG